MEPQTSLRLGSCRCFQVFRVLREVQETQEQSYWEARYLKWADTNLLQWKLGGIVERPHSRPSIPSGILFFLSGITYIVSVITLKATSEFFFKPCLFRADHREARDGRQRHQGCSGTCAQASPPRVCGLTQRSDARFLSGVSAVPKTRSDDLGDFVQKAEGKSGT